MMFHPDQWGVSGSSQGKWDVSRGMQCSYTIVEYVCRHSCMCMHGIYSYNQLRLIHEVKMYLQNTRNIFIYFQGSPSFHHEPRGCCDKENCFHQRRGWPATWVEPVAFSPRFRYPKFVGCSKVFPIFHPLLMEMLQLNVYFPVLSPPTHWKTARRFWLAPEAYRNSLIIRSAGEVEGVVDCLLMAIVVMVAAAVEDDYKLYSCHCRCCFHDD